MSTAPKPAQPPRADPVEVFGLRCRCRARLWRSGEIDLHTALDELQESAVASGLVAQIGQDAVQRLMVDAFAPEKTDEQINSGRPVAGSTLRAAEYLMREGDVAVFCAWFDQHTPQERVEILDHLERRRRARGRK